MHPNQASLCRLLNFSNDVSINFPAAIPAIFSILLVPFQLIPDFRPLLSNLLMINLFIWYIYNLDLDKKKNIYTKNIVKYKNLIF